MRYQCVSRFLSKVASLIEFNYLVFEMGKEFTQVIVNEVPPEHEDDVQQAADECPVEAIIVE